MAPPREERIRRQKLDGGDPDDTVYLPAGSAGGNGATHYHEDKDCPNLTMAPNTREKTRAAAQRQWNAPCRACVLEDGDDANTVACPDCSEEFMRLTDVTRHYQLAHGDGDDAAAVADGGAPAE